MALAGYPYLEAEPEKHFRNLQASDVMSEEVVSLSEIETAERISEVLTPRAAPLRHRLPVACQLPYQSPAIRLPIACQWPSFPLPSNRLPIASLSDRMLFISLLHVSSTGQVLRTTTHHAFPVIDTGADDSSRGFLKGSVVRYQLEVLPPP